MPPPGNSASYEHLPPVDPISGGLPQQGLVLHDAAHGDASSFPVLKAFQDYLEMERQQARKRLVTLTVFFVSLMTLVVAGFIVAFVYMYGNMSKREDRLLEAALQQRKDVAPPAPAESMAQQAAREFQAAAQNLQTNLGSQLASVGSVATKLDSKVDAQNAEMAKMREALAAMQKENDKLRTDMPKLALEAARRAPSPAASSVAPATMSRSGAGTMLPATTTAGTPAASSGRAPKGYEEAVLLVRTRDSDTTIPWRTFVPK